MLARFGGEQDGANAVEFALLLPVLIMLLFGTIYGASLFNSYQTVTMAAREGARYGATLPLSHYEDDPPWPPDTQWYEDIEERVEGILDVDRPLTPGQPTVCVRFYDGDGSHEQNSPDEDICPPPPATSAAQGPRVEVIAVRPSRLEIGMASFGPIPLRGSAVARYEPDDL